ncbi:MAG: hypothetical protein AB7O26_11105 [Planctomycetaceae bacterium]
MLTRLLRRTTAAMLIVAFVATLVGMPVVKLPAKDRSQPFPCQDRPCGCASAEQCFKKCCCFSDSQKREWAVQHDVPLPSAPADETETADAGTQVSTHGLACADDGAPCHLHTAMESAEADSSRRKSCCHKSTQVAGSQPVESTQVRGESCCTKPAEKDDAQAEVQLVIGTLARGCQGLSSVWTLLGAVMLPEIPSTWTFDASVVGIVADIPLIPHSADLLPPVPPPRLSVSSAPSTAFV